MASVEVDKRPPEPAGRDSQWKSPRIHVNSEPVSTDSLVTVRLSTTDSDPSHPDDTETTSTGYENTTQPSSTYESTHGHRPKGSHPVNIDFSSEEEIAFGRMDFDNAVEIHTTDIPFGEQEHRPRVRSDSSSSDRSRDSGTVNWYELEKTEEEETRDEITDESTTFLLARLEQENNALAADARFGLKGRPRNDSRPPSIGVLKRLVDPTSKASRHSLLSSPPPMTELEFWSALVKDYPQTVQRLPTLTSNKIKAGVPPPLRGVVWMSMVGARDPDLAERFDKLVLETSPYENLIGKDIGRSFPGVEMFRDAEGEGQQMLARVLKAFSLYDKEIGYCQGLGFLVGPLLMQMGDKDAFCVLVKLMENYDLRSCFLPNLAGLHLRIYQFQRLLDQHMPELSAHLASLQIEAAYLSQWFLSFFAVTCPLPMLFRIYDVIFAEGASETIMRVALSLMRRNTDRIMQSHEFEEVMHLLLSRSLWEPYAYDADYFVNDFVEMTGVVTRDSLKNLETAFKAAHGDSGAWFTFIPDASAAASRFLGRLLTSHTPSKSATLSPGQAAAATSRPGSFIRRTLSKQSISTNFTVTDTSSEGTNSVGTVTTEATEVSRESNVDAASLTSKSESLGTPAAGTMTKEDKDLHTQIEDLLTALSEMQREQALLGAQLQREREERGEDQQAFQELLRHIKPEAPEETDLEQRRRTMQYPMAEEEKANPPADDRRQTMSFPNDSSKPSFSGSPELNSALERADRRVALFRDARQSRSSQIMETKQRLRDSLIRSRDQLQAESSRSASLLRQLEDQERETVQVRDSLRDAQNRLQEGLKEKQKLEQTVQELRTRSRSGSLGYESDPPTPGIYRSDTNESMMSVSSGGHRDSVSSASGGMRELRLGRSDSLAGSRPKLAVTGSASIPKRTTSLATQAILSTQDHAPATEDHLLVELVNAKTSEAVARQELEEVKGKLDALRKMLDLPTPTLEIPAGAGHKQNTSESTIVPSRSSQKPGTPSESTDSNASTPSTSGGGVLNFWSWGKRSTSSTTSPGPAQAQVQAGAVEAWRQ